MNFEFDRATDEEMNAPKSKRGAKSTWPLSQMVPGDAFTAKQGQYGKSSVANYPHIYGKQAGMKFIVRKTDVDTYRIVRIA